MPRRPLTDLHVRNSGRDIYMAVRSIAAAVNRVIVHALAPITTNDGGGI